MDDPYAALARYYDAENAGLVEDFAAYDHLANRFGGPVLDVGCGTGRVAFHLVRRGLRVVGIDTSPAMLERARVRAQKHQIADPPLALHQASVVSLVLPERFALALLTYHTFMHFVSPEQQIAALESIAAHLIPGGGLAIDLPNPIPMFRSDDVAALVLERTFIDPETGHQVMQQSVTGLDRAAQVMQVLWVYDRVAPDGTITRQVVPLSLRYTFAAEMRLLLARTGFEDVNICGDYDFSPYEEDSPRMLAVARVRR